MNEFSPKVNMEGYCVLQAADVDAERTGFFAGYIAFGNWTDDPNGPSVRFHGGTVFSSCLQNAPSLQYDLYGECHVVFWEWMNPGNCPHAFDNKYVRQVVRFVQRNIPILLLVYHRYLDKEAALAYFCGKTTWDEMLSRIDGIPDDTYPGILACQNNAQLHVFCVREMIYGKVQPEKDEASLINEALMCHVKPVFELEYDGDGARLVGYHGNQETVWIPEEVTAIDDYVFAGHKEISKIVFPNALQEIGVKAFSGCTGIVTLLFPSAVRLICDYAFENCISLRYACVDDAGKPEWIEFGQRPFDGCIALEEVRLPEPEWWEDNPFQNCPLLHTIDIIGKSSIEQYNAIIRNNELLAGCNGTLIPNGVKTICNRAFVNSPGLRELEIPDSVCNIEEDAFVQHPNLVLLCTPGSAAEEFAKRNDISYRLVEH